MAALDAAFNAKAEALKDVLLEKLFSLVNGKTSQGVFNDLGEEMIPKGRKHTQRGLKENRRLYTLALWWLDYR